MYRSVVALTALAIGVPLALQSGAFASGAPASAACGLPSKSVVLAAAQLPENANAVACDAVGRVVDLGPGKVRVPAPGHGVGMSVDTVSGDDAYLEVWTDAAGKVHYSTDKRGQSDHQSGSASAATIPAGTGDGCGQNGYYIYPGTSAHKIYSARAYYTGPNAAETGSATSFRMAAGYAAANWVNETSPCATKNLASVPGFTWMGTTTSRANIGSDPSGELDCTNNDSRSTIDTGQLPATAVGAACWWTITHSSGINAVTNFDIRLNTSIFNFTLDPDNGSCSNQYDVISIFTHEFGHVLGLGHTTTVQNNEQSMFKNAATCSRHARDLGLGDVYGIRAIY